MNLSPLPAAGPTGAEPLQGSAAPIAASAPFAAFLTPAVTAATTPGPAANASAIAADTDAMPATEPVLDGRIPDTGRSPFRLFSALPLVNPQELEAVPIEANDTESGPDIGSSFEWLSVADAPAPAPEPDQADFAFALAVEPITPDAVAAELRSTPLPLPLPLPGQLPTSAEAPAQTHGQNGRPALPIDSAELSQRLPAPTQTPAEPLRAAIDRPVPAGQAVGQPAAAPQPTPTAHPAALAALAAVAEPRLASSSAGAESSQVSALAALGGTQSETRATASTALSASAFANPTGSAASGNEANQRAADLSAQLTWQLGNRVNRAEIRLSPPELGSVTVNVEQDGKQLRVEFSAPLAEARQALEESLPRLRELLTAHGHDLVRAHVGGDNPSHKQAAPTPWQRGPSGPGDPETSESAGQTRTLASTAHRGLLDEYA